VQPKDLPESVPPVKKTAEVYATYSLQSWSWAEDLPKAIEVAISAGTGGGAGVAVAMMKAFVTLMSKGDIFKTARLSFPVTDWEKVSYQLDGTIDVPYALEEDLGFGYGNHTELTLTMRPTNSIWTDGKALDYMGLGEVHVSVKTYYTFMHGGGDCSTTGQYSGTFWVAARVTGNETEGFELELLNAQWGAPGQLVQPTIKVCWYDGPMMAGLFWQLKDYDFSDYFTVQIRLGDGAKTVLRTPREPISIVVGHAERDAAWEVTVHELTPDPGQ